MIGYAKKIEKIIRESAFDKKKKKPGLKLNPGLALTGVRTNGPWCCTSIKLISIAEVHTIYVNLGQCI